MPMSGATIVAIDTATGSIISVVEVFCTHMLTKPVAHIMPSTRALGLPAGARDDGIGDAAVQVASLHRKPEQESAEDQEERRVAVARGEARGRSGAERRQDRERHERGRGEREGFGRPPDRHEDHRSCNRPGRG